MKCNVVRDLLPLYLDQLCEEETRQEIQEHLEHCEDCRQHYEAMDSPVEQIIDEAANASVSIDPMKKYHKKIKRKNKLLAFVLLLSTVIIGTLAYLSYGQIRQTGVSFETISQYIRFHHIGKEFADGNVEPLLSSLAMMVDGQEYAYYIRQAYNDNENAYLKDSREYLENRYSEYFQGKPLKLRKVLVEYNTNLVYESRTLLVILLYEIDDIEYYIRLERRGGGKYYVMQDEFIESSEVQTYTYSGEDDDETEETEESDGEESQTSLSPLLDNGETFFQGLPPVDSMNFFVARRAIRSGYQEVLESKSSINPYLFMTSLLYTTEECQKDRSLREAYEESMLQQAEKIIQQNYWIQDIWFNVLSYDKEAHMFRYQVSLSLINTETEEECELMVEAHWQSSKMVIIPGTEKLIGGNISEEARAVMLDLWKMP